MPSGQPGGPWIKQSGLFYHKHWSDKTEVALRCNEKRCSLTFDPYEKAKHSFTDDESKECTLKRTGLKGR